MSQETDHPYFFQLNKKISKEYRDIAENISVMADTFIHPDRQPSCRRAALSFGFTAGLHAFFIYNNSF